MKKEIVLMSCLAIVGTGAIAGPKLLICGAQDVNCQSPEQSLDLQSLKIVPGSNGDSFVKAVKASTINPDPDPDPSPSNCPSPQLARVNVDIAFGGSVLRKVVMQKGQVHVVQFKPAANHFGEISWANAVSADYETSKLAVISSCPGVVTYSDSVRPCRKSGTEATLSYSTGNESGGCRLTAGKTYYFNMVSGYDFSLGTLDFGSINQCPSGKSCNVQLKAN